MQTLNNEWLTDGLVDFEYKKYILLAYFKSVKQSFNKIELYPFMADMVVHYNNLINLKIGKDTLKNQFPQSLTGIDAQKLRLVYKQMVADDEIMKELGEIVEYAIPKFKETLVEGKEIYDFVEKNCEITPVGMIPLYTDEGYFFLGNSGKDITVHRFQVMRFEAPDQNFRGINTTFISSISKGLGESFESLKIGLIRKFKDLPNPATYLIMSKLSFPYEATLIPIAKRLLVKYISTT
ncbi:MAG TPA: hypothetical protein PKL31_04620 [Fulvivirga sp.]|nr:hypothetical protein [Fulvivirga sp.]